MPAPELASAGKGEDVVVSSMFARLSSFTDYFVILSGRSTRHVQALAESMESELRSKRISTSRAEGPHRG
jgi:ribosome-associated protein